MKKATPQESFDKFVLKVEKKLLNIDALREKDEDDLKDKLYVHRTTMERQDEKITLIQEEMKEHVAKLKYLDQYQREMSIDLTKTQKELDGKETVANHQDLLTRFNKFSCIETIEILDTKYIPKMEGFCQKLDEYLFSNQEVRDCI